LAPRAADLLGFIYKKTVAWQTRGDKGAHPTLTEAVHETTGQTFREVFHI
jgi:hypothetical protein